MKQLMLTIIALAIAAAPAFAQSVRRLDFASDFETVPVMGNTPGAFGATFQTYVAILNPTACTVKTPWPLARTRTGTVKGARSEPSRVTFGATPLGSSDRT